ncbi:sphingosine-1-phosphate phosphatase 2 isoform X2 [Lates japonicus]|uniref:Sphingosine-1-phosphate phosphatase 2 isoform X2 n=1 Tax=Lates japonicus TaxID=270547 RepID=A0AAD3R0N2_LATJO|nr:sphingosine-1-phosphate phosphatase 2 isoform X2 [Lates japonicus]
MKDVLKLPRPRSPVVKLETRVDAEYECRPTPWLPCISFTFTGPMRIQLTSCISPIVAWYLFFLSYMPELDHYNLSAGVLRPPF